MIISAPVPQKALGGKRVQVEFLDNKKRISIYKTANSIMQKTVLSNIKSDGTVDIEITPEMFKNNDTGIIIHTIVTY